MVLDYYDLREQPFGATPDSRYLFASEAHREAHASILYGIEQSRGFMTLIAKPGMGKTTLLFSCLNQLRTKGRTVFLFQSIVTRLDFLRALLADLGVEETQGDMFELQAKLNAILLEQASRGECLVVVIDESQNLDESVLELVRMLSNFETPRKKLLQIILAGQPQLAQTLASPRLVQLRQRVSIVAHLRPLTYDETVQYIEYRLKTAGRNPEKALFTRAAMRLIWEHSEGVPRSINNLCFNAMSIGRALKRKIIDADIIHEVISDLDLRRFAEMPAHEATAPSYSPRIMPAGKKPRKGTWLFKVAMTGALLLILSGGPISSRSRANVQANTVPRSMSGPVSLAAPSSPPRLSSKAKIRVLPGQNLSHICAQVFQTCDPRELLEIRRLNPWLKNPNHLESGRELLVPGRPELSQAGVEQEVTSPRGGSNTMSRNFELMQELGRNTAPRIRRGPPDATFVAADKTVEYSGNLNLPDDETLQLVQQIFLVQTQNPPRTVVFAGINHGDGCSRISASAAETLAKNVRGSVCLVEANFRSPSLPGMFGTTNHHGFTNSLLSEDPIRSFAKPVNSGGKLWLLSSGVLGSDSANLLNSERLKARLSELRSEFEFVIIDAPPLTHYTDALAIGQFTDGIVVILEAGTTRREVAQAATARLRTSQIPILGAVLNKRTFPIPESIYQKI